MGNQKIKGLPTVFAKNWSSIYEGSDLYCNNLTGEIVKRNIVKIEYENQIQEFRQRMKQTNSNICRVYFFHHYENNIYIVYTDQTKNKLEVKNNNEWKSAKQNILKIFMSLSNKYGPMRVFPEMIGANSNNEMKIWINSNPIINIPEVPCDTQIQMIEDILIICKAMQQESLEHLKNKNFKKSYSTFHFKQKQHQSNKQKFRMHKSNSLPLDFQNKSNLQQVSIYNKNHRKLPKRTCPHFLLHKQNQQTQSFSPCSYSPSYEYQNVSWDNANFKTFIKNKKKHIRTKSMILTKFRPQINEEQISIKKDKQSKITTHNNIDKITSHPHFLDTKKSSNHNKKIQLLLQNIDKNLNMTKQLRNVAYMPVKQQNEGESTQRKLSQTQQQNDYLKQSLSTVDTNLLNGREKQIKQEQLKLKYPIDNHHQKYSSFCKAITQILDQ